MKKLLCISVFTLWACSSAAPGDVDGNDDVDSGASVEACPAQHGPAMQRIELGDMSYCIDKTEVTRAHYAEFVSAGAPAESSPPKTCESTAPGAPDAECLLEPDLCNGAGCDDHPQVCVGFCDASAYCAWAGKRLCGAVDTGALAVDSTTVRSSTRWELACSGGFTSEGVVKRRYPYGAGFDESRCNVASGTTTAAGSREECGTVEYPDVRDLSGNVYEFVGQLIVDDYLVQATARGGYYANEFGGDPSVGVRCDSQLTVDTFVGGRQSALPNVGFRCCD